jgi:hypothetical protein
MHIALPEDYLEDDLDLYNFQRQNKCVASAVSGEENALPTHLKVKSFPCFRVARQKNKIVRIQRKRFISRQLCFCGMGARAAPHSLAL